MTVATGILPVALADFRKRLFELIDEVSSDPLAVVSIRRRADVSALLVSFERFGPLLDAIDSTSHEQGTRQMLLWLIIERWLIKAPPHLREAQRRELAELPVEHLMELFRADPTRTRAKDISRLGIDSRIAERLVKRQQLARSIADAEKAGLYEAIDHKTSEAV
jgi:hypothetical protein